MLIEEWMLPYVTTLPRNRTKEANPFRMLSERDTIVGWAEHDFGPWCAEYTAIPRDYDVSCEGFYADAGPPFIDVNFQDSPDIAVAKSGGSEYVYKGRDYDILELYNLVDHPKVSYRLFRTRVSKGWSVESAHHTPLHKHGDIEPLDGVYDTYYYGGKWLSAEQIYNRLAPRPKNRSKFFTDLISRGYAEPHVPPHPFNIGPIEGIYAGKRNG